ncbi:MAG: DHA2 family efflux MFS transporter permease subunit [Hyphomicrobiaceae bacterium]
MSDDAVYEVTTLQRALIVVFVALSTILYASSILIVSALLPQMQGTLGATQDEVSWAMTFNIVATAVVTPMTGWISERFGRRNTMVWCCTVFAASTFLCGTATTLEELILWRIIQGIAGAPLIPLGHTLLLDTSPRHQHGKVLAIYGMANVVGPVIGPTIGGEVSQLYGWQWAFWMIVPLALITAVGFRFILPVRPNRESPHLDWSGFLTLSIAVAGAQLVFSRGQRLDWFQSQEIIVATLLACIAFYMFVVHSLTADRPFVRLSLFRDRNYALGMLLVFFYGMLNFAPVVLLPPLLQNHASYTDAAIGAFIGWRGVGAAMGAAFAMLTGRIDARLMMMLGFGMQVYGGWGMMQYDLNVSPSLLAFNTVLQGIGIGIAWIPITVVTFATLAPEARGEAMGMFHLLRNFGSSIFISVAVAEIVRTSSVNYSRMVETVSPFNNVWYMPWATGSWSLDSSVGMAKFAGEIGRQAAMIGYMNAFTMYTWVAVAAIPLCLLARMPKSNAG